MPIDDLASVIETLQQRIRQHGSSLRENEIHTRMALIDPLLPALGWDVSDPALATPEYAVGNARVDYALLGADGKPAALLEAKRLGESLDSHRMQMVNYANMSGIPYAGLTDGDHWELYEVFAQKPIEERRLLEVSIAASPAHQSALRLLLLWRPNLASGQPTAASAPILRPATSEPEPIPDAPTAPTSLLPGWIALSSFSRSDTTKAPSAIRFSDGAEHPVQYWRHLIERTAAWLWARGLLTRSNLPVPVPGGSRYVANTEPVHKSGKEFIAPQHIDGAPVIVEGNVGGGQAISYTAKLLQHCGVNPPPMYPSQPGHNPPNRRRHATPMPPPAPSLPGDADAVLAEAAARLEAILANQCRRLTPFPAFMGMATIQAVELEPALTAPRDRGCVVVTPEGTIAALDIAAIPGIVGVLEVDQVEEFKPLDDLAAEEYLIYLLAAVRQLDAELRRRGD